MKVTEYRTMIYLPKSLYLESVRKAKRANVSFSEVVREALKNYVSDAPKSELEASIRAGFGLWKDYKIDSYKYVRKLREGWAKRERRFRY